MDDLIAPNDNHICETNFIVPNYIYNCVDLFIVPFNTLVMWAILLHHKIPTKCKYYYVHYQKTGILTTRGQ